MTLFVVVQRNKRTGVEYLHESSIEGFTEYAQALQCAENERLLEGDMFEMYVGRVVPAEFS